MTLYVEGGKLITARAALKNPSPERLDYKVQVALYPTGTVVTPAAQSAIAALTIGGGAQASVDLPLSAPAETLLCDSYILGMFLSKVTGRWEVAMASFSFEGVRVYSLTEVSGRFTGWSYSYEPPGGYLTAWRSGVSPPPQIPVGSRFYLSLKLDNRSTVDSGVSTRHPATLRKPDGTLLDITSYSRKVAYLAQSGYTAFSWTLDEKGLYVVEADLMAYVGPPDLPMPNWFMLGVRCNYTVAEAV